MKKLKKLLVLSVLVTSVSVVALFGSDDDKKDISKAALKAKAAKDCEIPAFAKAIGHEDKWLLHNGCPPRKDAKKDKSK